MGVFNGSTLLRKTIDSIRGQTFTDFEFVIVDDASTDETPDILAEVAKADPRIRVFRQQENQGLTKALIRGCQEARGKYIARQDNGDFSFRHRLGKQTQFLESHPDVVAVGTGFRRIGPKHEYLGDCSRTLSPGEVTRIFLESGTAIVHATSMIRKSALDAVGGYRWQFRVAQDTDLWYRFSTIGLLGELPEVLCHIAIDLRGISATSNSKQHRLARIAKELHIARLERASVVGLLEDAARVSYEKSTETSRTQASAVGLAQANYFIGSELYSLRDSACRKYLWKSIKCKRQATRALLKIALSLLKCSTKELVNINA